MSSPEKHSFQSGIGDLSFLIRDIIAACGGSHPFGNPPGAQSQMAHSFSEAAIASLACDSSMSSENVTLRAKAFRMLRRDTAIFLNIVSALKCVTALRVAISYVRSEYKKCGVKNFVFQSGKKSFRQVDADSASERSRIYNQVRIVNREQRNHFVGNWVIGRIT